MVKNNDRIVIGAPGFKQSIRAIKIDAADEAIGEQVGLGRNTTALVAETENAKRSPKGLGNKIKGAVQNVKEKLVGVGERVKEKMPGSDERKRREIERYEFEKYDHIIF